MSTSIPRYVMVKIQLCIYIYSVLDSHTSLSTTVRYGFYSAVVQKSSSIKHGRCDAGVDALLTQHLTQLTRRSHSLRFPLFGTNDRFDLLTLRT